MSKIINFIKIINIQRDYKEFNNQYKQSNSMKIIYNFY